MDQIIIDCMTWGFPDFVKGLVSFQLAFMIAQFGLNKRPEYFWYAGYLFCALFFSWGVDTESGFETAKNDFLFKVFVPLTTICYWFFWKSFFELKKSDTRLYQLLFGVTAAQVFTLAVLVLAHFGLLSQNFAENWFNFSPAIPLLLSLGQFYFTWKKERTLLAGLLIAAAFLGNFFNFFPYFNLPILSGKHFYFFGLLGFLVETTLLSIALAVKTQRIFEENKRLEIRVATAMMTALQAQMNPHFLFNCLNAVNRFLLNNENDAATAYLTKFSKLMRSVLDSSRQNTTSLARELNGIRLYSEMESLRFGGQFQFSFDLRQGISPDDIQLPPMLIQPLVENAIYHGLLPKEGDKNLQVVVEKEGKMLKISVIDNGIGRQQSDSNKTIGAIKEKSYGLQIIRERLSEYQKIAGKETNLILIDLQNADGNPAGTAAVLAIEL